MTTRIFNIIASVTAGIFFLLPFIFICILIKITSTGPIIHWSKRVGINNKLFLMPKFRTMKDNTPQKATHLLANGQSYLTPVGGFLRKASLDELPQLWSILIGDMNIVGPRPALFNQDDLIELRTKHKIQTIPPGLTGWAQINGRDEISIQEKVELERYYLDQRSFLFDLKIIFLTAYKVIMRADVSH